MLAIHSSTDGIFAGHSRCLHNGYGAVSVTVAVRSRERKPQRPLLAASFISIFIGFSASLSSFAVQTYLNRRVPALLQGRVFGAQSAFGNLVAIAPLLMLGTVAELTSIELILFLAPWIVVGLIYALLVLASRMAGHERPRGNQVLASFWREPDELEAPAGT